MSKKYRVKRYSYKKSGYQSQNWNKIIIGGFIILLGAGIGWMGFDPISNFITNIGNHISAPPPLVKDPISSQISSSQLPTSSSHSEETESPVKELFPQDTYHLTSQTMKNTDSLSTALADIKSKGGTGVSFDIKDAQGYIHYSSNLSVFKTNYKAIPEVTFDLKMVIDQIEKAGLIPVAHVSTFHDSIAPVSLQESAVKYQNSKINWIDNAKADGGKTWLNPNHVDAQGYILDIIKEITSMGIKHVVLQGVQFPTGYSLELATYGNTGALDKSQILSDFILKAETMAQSNGAEIWPVVGLDAMVGINPTPYGNNPEKLLDATTRGIIDVRPEQFGNGVATDELTISTPILLPYDTIVAGLALASKEFPLDDYTLTAMIQAYGAVSGGEYVNYGAKEIQLQKDAVNKYSIENIIYYNSLGTYNY